MRPTPTTATLRGSDIVQHECTILCMKATLILLLAAVPGVFGAEIRLGIIGTDTSHVPTLPRTLNDSPSPDHIDGARVIAAYKGRSKDLAISFKRVDNFAQEIRTKDGVEIVPDIPALPA